MKEDNIDYLDDYGKAPQKHVVGTC